VGALTGRTGRVAKFRRIGEGGGDANGAGLLIHLPVDESDLPFVRIRLPLKVSG